MLGTSYILFCSTGFSYWTLVRAKNQELRVGNVSACISGKAKVPGSSAWSWHRILMGAPFDKVSFVFLISGMWMFCIRERYCCGRKSRYLHLAECLWKKNCRSTTTTTTTMTTTTTTTTTTTSPAQIEEYFLALEMSEKCHGKCLQLFLRKKSDLAALVSFKGIHKPIWWLFWAPKFFCCLPEIQRLGEAAERDIPGPFDWPIDQCRANSMSLSWITI